MKPLAALLLSFALAMPAKAAPLIADGSFETGDFTGWTQSGNTEFTSVFDQNYDGLYAQDGIYYALLGPAGTDRHPVAILHRRAGCGTAYQLLGVEQTAAR